MTSGHPSSYALDKGGHDVEAHLGSCPTCRARAQAARGIDDRFEADVLPRTLGRVRSRLATPPARSWWRYLIVGSGLAAAVATLVLVVRVPTSDRDAVPYAGLKGEAALPFAVFVKRGADVWALAPGQKLRAGDAVRFVARVAQPRYLELRGRDDSGKERTLFPAGPRAALVHPGEALPGGFVVDAAPGPEILVALIADHAFELGQAPTAGVELVHVELPKEP